MNGAESCPECPELSTIVLTQRFQLFGNEIARQYAKGFDKPESDTAGDAFEAFRFLEEHDAERVPVVERGRLVGEPAAVQPCADSALGRLALRPLQPPDDRDFGAAVERYDGQMIYLKDGSSPFNHSCLRC